MMKRFPYFDFLRVAVNQKKQLLFLPILILIGSSALQGQEAVVMSNAVIDSLNEATYPYDQRNQHYELAHYQNLLRNAIANEHMRGIIESNHNLAQYYYHNDKQIDSLLYYYDQTTRLIETTDVANELLSKVYTFKGIYLSLSGMEFLSLEPFEKAYEAALEYGDSLEVVRARVNLAELNEELGNYEKSINLASGLLDEFPDLAEEGKVVLNGTIGACLVQTQKPEEGLTFLKTSDSIYKQGMNPSMIIDVRTWMAQAYIDLGDHERAILICETTATEFPDSPFDIHQFTSLVYGNALLKNGQNSKAIQIFEEGLTSANKNREYYTILETLGFVYLSQGKFEKSKPLFTEAVRIRDSIENFRAQRFSHYSSMSYNLLETQFKNENLSHANEVLEAKAIRRDYIMGVLVLSIAVLLLLGIGYILWKKYHSGKKTIKSLKANEKAILEAHIKLREDELGVTMNHLNKSMETLNTIASDLGEIIQQKDYAALKTIKNALKEHQESSSATSLLTNRIESQYPRMTAQLLNRYPSFTANDVKHCLMLKLGLSLKETAQLFNITVAAVKSARGRMRKKMGLAPNDSLREHLSFIAKSA